MTTASIEIQDAGLVALREGEAEPGPESPGYAVVEGKLVLTGLAALAKARLFPRHCYTRMWDQLDRTPLPRPFPSKLTPADLAHAHLSAVWEEVGRGMDRAVLLVPAHYGDEQLGLLLGIARSCDVPVVALVDLALSAVLDTDAEVAIHLDIHLHRALGVRVTGGDVLARERVATDDSVGLIDLYNEWARLISQKFVRETRFDPLHAGASEQRLYDLLPSVLRALRERDSVAVTLETGPGSARKGNAEEQGVEVTRQELVEAALPYYRKISSLVRTLDPEQSWPHLFLSPTVAILPGLSNLLVRDVAPLVTALATGAASRNALAYRRRFPRRSAADESIPFVTTLSRASEEAPVEVSPPPPAARTRPERMPTHVLFEGVAHPIDPGPFLLGIAIPEGHRGLNFDGAAGVSRYHCTIDRIEERVVIEDHSRYGSFVNGKRIEGKTPLHTGDRLALGTTAIEVALIEVED
jgi:FHA domain